MNNTEKTTRTLQSVIDEIGGASELHGTTNLAKECQTQTAELIASRGGFDVYALECGDCWFLSANDASTHLVTSDDLDDYNSEAARVVGAVTELTGDMLDVVFDNGGGITVQARGFVHSYEDAKQAANDVKEILKADYDPTQWEGDEPNCYQGFSADPEIERNGGYTWLGREDITEAIKTGELEDCDGYAMAEFFTALGVKITDENYAR